MQVDRGSVRRVKVKKSAYYTKAITIDPKEGMERRVKMEEKL